MRLQKTGGTPHPITIASLFRILDIHKMTLHEFFKDME